jgi:hypothetical protein
METMTTKTHRTEIHIETHEIKVIRFGRRAADDVRAYGSEGDDAETRGNLGPAQDGGEDNETTNQKD